MITTHLNITNKVVILGFGSIGQAVLPLLFKHFENCSPSQLLIISKDNDGLEVARHFGCELLQLTITKENFYPILNDYLSKGDFLLNLSVDISSLDLIKFCQSKSCLYLDTSSEPWEGAYHDGDTAPAARTNYALREAILEIKTNSTSTAVLTHGANPGLVSHFVKQALLNIAHDNGLDILPPKQASEWAQLAQQLEIKAIHIAERDTQVCLGGKRPHQFINTWSIPGLISEAGQPAELGWGTHEKHWPEDGSQHEQGSNCAIYLNRPGASVKVRTWTPTAGAFHGFLITHAESISIANYLTLLEDGRAIYRPTVHYAYFPCPDATLSLHEFSGTEWLHDKTNILIKNDIVDGMDELGVLLMGNQLGAYWYGSQLTIQEARSKALFNNATSLQVAAGVLAGMLWAICNPEQGIVEPEEMDFQFILEVAKPYLGTLDGYYTEWNPLENRQRLFPEKLDTNDPWQFLNIRVQ